MRKNIQRNRFLTYLITFVFVLSFLALGPSDNARAAVNLASGKLPTSSVAFTNLSRVTDGNRATSSYADSYVNSGVNWVQINLGASYNINNIKLWHYYGDSRKYHDVVVQLSTTSDFSSPITVYNNDTDGSAGRGTGSDGEYAETNAGLNVAFNGVNAQYVRFYSNGSTANAYNHYVEIEIYQGTTQITGNLASGKTTTSSAAFTGISRVTDNIVNTNSYADSYSNSGIQWVQIDLGASYNVNNIKLWHYFGDSRKYNDVIVQLSNSSNFSSAITTVYNNDTNNSANRGIGSNSEYTETISGLDLEFNATNARYVRFYSNGSTANTYNHYVEIEIYASAGAVHPTSVSLNKTTTTLAAGGTETLTSAVLPADAANKSVTWSTSAAGIATVGASTGLVTGVAAGTAIITATTVDGGLKATCTVTVAVAATSSNIVSGKLPTSSKAFTNLVRVTDGNKNTNNYADSYTNSGLQWIQFDLGANYNVSSIKLWHYFGDTRKYRDVVVQLSNDPTFATGVTSVYNNDTNNSAGRGTGSSSEYSETSAGLSIAVSNLSARYARFYSNGSSVNVYNHYVEVEIYGLPTTVHPTSVSVNKPAATIAIGSTDTLSAIFVPSGTTNTNVTWESSAPAVATVGTSTGVVTGVSVGSATITATTEDGGLTATSSVTIVDAVHPDSVTLNKTTESLIEAKLMTLTATVKPDNAANKTVAWSTSDSNVAAVSSKGVVTGINPGTANITATTNDGKLQTTCAVTVTTGKITGDKTAYANDNDNLETIYVTIMTGNTATMADVNNWTADTEVKPSLNVRFDYGTAASDLTGVVSNATFGPRGQGTSFAALKSYKIKLSDTATKWKSQKTLNLNKHPYDITKVRNKLAFDLMKMFPDTFSLRTQFCRLYIRDLNSSNKQYVDYGLFTQVEEPNKDFLESRGIEKTAYFYKAEGFRFETYPDIIKNVTDPTYNKTEFEEILGIEGTEEHSRLISMLKDVNDETQDINAVIDKWFDRDNYVTWIAMNLLIGNTDTVDSNFFLLSPVDQEKWYFVPWDYDYSLGSINAPNADNSWMAPYMMDGISLYWGISMHRRFLEDPENLAAVTAKLEELSTIATKAVVTDKVSKYYASTRAIVNRLPDTKVREGTLQVYESEIKRLSNVLDDAKETYYDGFANPMPVVTEGVQVSGGKATFTWEEAYKFDNDTLRYDFTLSSDPEFNDIVDESTGMLGTSVVVDSLPAGTYYWKVEVYDTSGNRTMSVDYYRETVSDTFYFGVRQLIVN